MLPPSSILAAFVALATLSVATGSNVFEINLETRHKFGEISLENLARDAAEIQQLGKGGDMPMWNVRNLYYVGQVDVGTPRQGTRRQTFNVTVDNMIAEPYIMDKAVCRLPQWKDRCGNHTEYECKKSSTCSRGKKFSVSDIMSGVIIKETFNISNLLTPNVKFGAIRNMNEQVIGVRKYDGMIGLAYPNASMVPGVKPIMYTMKEEGSIKNLLFSLSLDNCTCGCTMNKLVMGGVDKKTCKGDITWANVTEKKLFKIKIGGAKLGSRSVLPAMDAVVAASLSLTYGPKTQFDEINKEIGATSMGSIWTVECDKIPSMPNVTWMINGESLVMTPWDYILRFDTSKAPTSVTKSLCISTFVGSPYINELYLSWAFLRSIPCTIFDMETDRVGFVHPPK